MVLVLIMAIQKTFFFLRISKTLGYLVTLVRNVMVGLGTAAIAAGAALTVPSHSSLEYPVFMSSRF